MVLDKPTYVVVHLVPTILTEIAPSRPHRTHSIKKSSHKEPSWTSNTSPFREDLSDQSKWNSLQTRLGAHPCTAKLARRHRHFERPRLYIVHTVQEIFGKHDAISRIPRISRSYMQIAPLDATTHSLSLNTTLGGRPLGKISSPL